MKLHGVFGRPFIDLAGFIDTSGFAEMDRELCLGLAQMSCGGTGATLKSMGVVAPWVMGDGRRDAMDAIRAMSDAELEELVALGDDPDAPLADRAALGFGDETDRPFTLAQQRLLELRHGVYFPWRWCFHLVENDRWEDKHSGEGKSFAAEALARFPRTCAFVRALPFTEIGRCVLFGLGPHDHAPLHRDSEPGASLEVAQSINFAPRAGKRFYLQNAPAAAPLVVESPIYWFNDMDYHGVLADPFFRYSLRVDGVFEEGFVEALRRRARTGL
jgi:Rieske 2Fe-2S family protein